jgi:FkbM family methyltransferase
MKVANNSSLKSWTIVASGIAIFLFFVAQTFMSNGTSSALAIPKNSDLSFMSDLPTSGLAVSVIQTTPPFLYTYLSIDQDSYQVADPNIRALEPAMTALWGHYVGPCCRQHNGHILDIGSHFGYYSLYSAALGCTFSAIEPVNTFRSILKMNLHLNGFTDQGRVYPFAAGNQDRQVSLVVPTSGILGTASVLPGDSQDQGQQKAQEKRVDDAVELDSSSKICGLKIDVEGYEPNALEGAAQLLKSKRVPIIMMEFSPDFSNNDAYLEKMLQTLHRIGYTAFEVNWGVAKQSSAPGMVDIKQTEKETVDISSEKSRQALIARARPNTNLWLTLKT